MAPGVGSSRINCQIARNTLINTSEQGRTQSFLPGTFPEAEAVTFVLKALLSSKGTCVLAGYF